MLPRTQTATHTRFYDNFLDEKSLRNFFFFIHSHLPFLFARFNTSIFLHQMNSRQGNATQNMCVRNKEWRQIKGFFFQAEKDEKNQTKPTEDGKQKQHGNEKAEIQLTSSTSHRNHLTILWMCQWVLFIVVVFFFFLLCIVYTWISRTPSDYTFVCWLYGSFAFQ